VVHVHLCFPQHWLKTTRDVCGMGFAQEAQVAQAL